MSTDTVSTSPTMKTTTLAASTCTSNIWANATICQIRKNYPMIRQAANKIHSRANWNILFYAKATGSTILMIQRTFLAITN